MQSRARRAGPGRAGRRFDCAGGLRAAQSSPLVRAQILPGSLATAVRPGRVITLVIPEKEAEPGKRS